MLFEIINDFFENFLLSYFITTYLKQENKKYIIIIATVINTIISVILSTLNVYGFTQTALIQIVLWCSLYFFNKKFSSQDIMISLFFNILLFISVYFSILTFSLLLKTTPNKIFLNTSVFTIEIIFSKSIFLILSSISLKKRPLLLSKTDNLKMDYFLIFELFVILLMEYYFMSDVIYSNESNSANIIFICFVLLFLSFCFIFNQMINMNNTLYKNRLKKQREEYINENLKNIKSIKYEVENIEHRMNYMLQSIEFDLEDQKFDDAMLKIKSYKNLITNNSHVINTNNELFDFMINLEIDFLSHQHKQLKICAFISKNQSYNDLVLINKIITILKLVCGYANEVELFLTEDTSKILEVKFIILTSPSIQNKIIESFQNQNDLKIVIHPLNKLLIIKYNESLDSHDF